MEDTIYDLLIEEMEKNFVRIPSKINENEIELSDNDESILITPRPLDCDTISIRGIRESKIKKILSSKPHSIFIKLYDYNGEEVLPNDTVRFSIIEPNKQASPCEQISPENVKRTVFYHYPYSLLSGGKFLGFKKGIVITKEKKLEIKFIRNGKPIKIGKLELIIECDRWMK